MNILYVTTIGGTMGFFKQLVQKLVREGNTVDIATNETDSKVPGCYREWGCRVYPVSCTRQVACTGNLRAARELREVVRRNGYDIVHCHTPVAAACARIACRGLRKNGVKVVYTAHGFHFYKGAPLKNWLFYYPVEKVLSYWTDCLVTINKEDYRRAQKKFHAKRTEYVPGVGIDLKKFCVPDFVQDIDGTHIPYMLWRKKKREEFGLVSEDFVIVSVGELNANKNHKVVIEAVARLKNKKIKYLICGKGGLEDELTGFIEKLGLEKQVFLLGFCNDIREILWMGDLFAFPSKREGLPVALMEAMASGIPCIASNIRGNRDLFGKEKVKYLLPTDKAERWEDVIRYCEGSTGDEMTLFRKKQEDMLHFSETKVLEKTGEIYSTL